MLKSKDVKDQERFNKRILVLLVMIGAVSLMGFAAFQRMGMVTGPVYTTAQIVAALEYDPHNWVGRTVLVRGTPIDASTPRIWQGSVLLDTDADAIARYRGRYLSHYIPGGSLRFDAPDTVLVLIVQGTPHEYLTPQDRLWRVLSHLPILGSSIRPYVLQGNQIPIYRARLLDPAHCAAALVAPCPTGVFQ